MEIETQDEDVDKPSSHLTILMGKVFTKRCQHKLSLGKPKESLQIGDVFGCRKETTRCSNHHILSS